ncbi:MAG: flagellar hook-basal body complex protein FliE [Lachnospiraceae bacterium]|nr:flagellar hook-basal body complex protein FliE [Lachnospiraceae bacterium]
MADVSGLTGTALELYNNAIGRMYTSGNTIESSEYNDSFSEIFSSALNMVNETNALAEKAEQAEINFSLGNADSITDVTIAQQKAYLSLQYTVAVKNAIMSAYKEIMNIQV